MNIAVLVHAFPVLSETFVLRQITGLLDRGHEVHIFAGHTDHTGISHPKIAAYRLLERTHYEPWVREDYYSHQHRPHFIGVPELTDAYDYDVLHCHFGPMGITGAVLRDLGLLNGKLITSFHGFDLSSFVQTAGADVYEFLFEHGERFIANSTYTAGKAIKLGCPPDKLVRLPVGLNPAEYPFESTRGQQSDPVRILTVGRFVEKKGIEYGIRAVAEVVKRHPNLEYRIVGDGPLRPELETLITELELETKVKLLGWQTEDGVRAQYAAASIFVLPSVTASNGDQEGLGLVLLEAQAMGLPVVASHHNGFPEAIIDGETGFLVPERDVTALAEKLLYLAEHPRIWPAFGEAGRANVTTNFNLDTLNDRLVNIFQTT